jgi:hypothetical protein
MKEKHYFEKVQHINRRMTSSPKSVVILFIGMLVQHWTSNTFSKHGFHDDKAYDLLNGRKDPIPNKSLSLVRDLDISYFNWLFSRLRLTGPMVFWTTTVFGTVLEYHIVDNARILIRNIRRLQSEELIILEILFRCRNGEGKMDKNIGKSLAKL